MYSMARLKPRKTRRHFVSWPHTREPIINRKCLQILSIVDEFDLGTSDAKFVVFSDQHSLPHSWPTRGFDYGRRARVTVTRKWMTKDPFNFVIVDCLFVGKLDPKVLCSTHSGNSNADRARFSRGVSFAACYCGKILWFLRLWLLLPSLDEDTCLCKSFHFKEGSGQGCPVAIQEAFSGILRYEYRRARARLALQRHLNKLLIGRNFYFWDRCIHWGLVAPGPTSYLGLQSTRGSLVSWTQSDRHLHRLERRWLAQLWSIRPFRVCIQIESSPSNLPLAYRRSKYRNGHKLWSIPWWSKPIFPQSPADLL